MGVLNKLFGKHEETPAEELNVQCPHTALTARWDKTEDIGKSDLATSFRCESCGETFSGDEGRRLLEQHHALSQ